MHKCHTGLCASSANSSLSTSDNIGHSGCPQDQWQMQLMSSTCLFRLLSSCKCPALNTENCVDSSHRLRTQSTVPAITSCILLYYTKFTLASLTLLAPTNITTLSGKQGNYYTGQEAFSNPKSVIHYNTVSQLYTMLLP